MKNIIKKLTLPGAFLLLGTVGCTKLEEGLNSTTTQDKAAAFLGATADLNVLIQSCYDGLQGYQTQDLATSLMENSSDESLVPTRGGDWDDNGVWRQIHTQTWAPDHGEVLGAWNSLLSNVYKCNQVIENGGTTAQVAEARFLRALSYWHLMDMFGNIPQYPNSEPNILYYYAVDAQYNLLSGTERRIDSVFYNPFIVPANYAMNFVIVVEDDSTAVDQLSYNKLKLSYDPDNFSSSAPGYQEIQAFVFTYPGNGNKYFMANVNTGSFSSGQVVYFRFYTNDGDHVGNTEYPYSSLPLPYKTFFSFYIQPGNCLCDCIAWIS